MTLPVAHGYPDYGRTYARADITYHDVSDADLDAVETLPRKFVGDRPYLGFFLSPSVNHIRIRFLFFDQPAGGTFRGVQVWEARDDTVARGNVSVTGSYMDVEVTPSAANAAYSLVCWGTDAPMPQHGADSTENSLVSIHNLVIGGGGSSITEHPLVWPGPASWTVHTNATAWDARLETISYLGTVRTLDRLGSGGQETHHQAYLPRAPLRTQILNLDGVDRTFSLYLTAHPLGQFG